MPQFIFCTSEFSQVLHLGPLLFVAFVNDVDDTLKSPCLLYAEDHDLKYKQTNKYLQVHKFLESFISYSA